MLLIYMMSFRMNPIIVITRVTAAHITRISDSASDNVMYIFIPPFRPKPRENDNEYAPIYADRMVSVSREPDEVQLKRPPMGLLLPGISRELPLGNGTYLTNIRFFGRRTPAVFILPHFIRSVKQKLLQ